MPLPAPETLRNAAGHAPCVLVTVAAVRGSAPRNPGARMLVSGDQQWDSIGGGNLEYQATLQAREMLRSGRLQQRLEFGLGPALNQCCGGAVTILLQRLDTPQVSQLATLETGPGCLLACRIDDAPASFRHWNTSGALPEDVPASLAQAGEPRLLDLAGESWFVEPLQARLQALALFGAGHVAQALVPLLSALPFELHWFDFREAGEPGSDTVAPRPLRTGDPDAAVAGLPPGTACLVMTHSHELDERLCQAILSRPQLPWLGLIGSASKRRRFEHRLARSGIGPGDLERLVCPIGMAGIDGKRPATIATSVAAQLLRDCLPTHLR